MLALSACLPEVDVDESVVSAPRLVAVRAEPAEAPLNASVTYRALVVSPEAGTPAPLDWAYCVARRPLAEAGPVNARCVAGEEGAISPLGSGLVVSGLMPQDACRLFGPDAPPATSDAPGGRPVDPDTTGGYAVPLRVEGEDTEVAFFAHRVTCGLPGATAQQSVEFRRRYHANANPVIEALELRRDGASELLGPGGARGVLAPGERVELAVRWPACPAEDTCGDGVCGADESAVSCADDCEVPVGCGGAERYVRFDGNGIVVEREAMRVSWLSTAPGLALERTGVASDDTSRESTNELVAPDEPGIVRGWVVLRDERGGVVWTSFELEVQ